MKKAKFDNIEAARRLLLVTRVPEFIGIGSQSSSISSFVGYSCDARIALSVTESVLKAIVCPNPHRDFGDDGYQESLQEDCLEILRWAEWWIEKREKEEWDSAKSRNYQIGVFS